MRTLKKKAAIFLALILAMAFFLTSCGGQGSAAAENYKSKHSSILTKTAAVVEISDKREVNNALSEYLALDVSAKKLLVSEKALLDKLLIKINELEFASFIAVHAAVLFKTVDNIAITDKDAVNNALKEYSDSDAAVKILLTGEKKLLDSLLKKIIEKEIASPGIAADNFKTTHSAILSKNAGAAAITDKSAVMYALSDYEFFDDTIKVLLESEKALLDSLLAAIQELEAAYMPIELLSFDKALTILCEGTEAEVFDVDTGISYRVKRVIGGYNTLADVETLNTEETNKLLQTSGSLSSMKRRAVIVTAGGKRIAASIAPLEHSGREDFPYGDIVDNRSGSTGRGINLDSIKNNGMTGVVDLYFFNSLIPGINRVDDSHQAMVMKAYAYEDQKKN